MKSLLAVAAVSTLAALFAAPATAAVCTSQSPLANVATPGAAAIGRSFSSAGNYKDCYTFTLATESDLGGFSQEVSLLFNRLFVDVTQVSLYWGGLAGNSTTGGLFGADTSPGLFAFNNLASGTYTLLIDAVVASQPGLFRSPVSYFGAIATRTSDVPLSRSNAVPEPGTVALVLAGLLAAAYRRQRV